MSAANGTAGGQVPAGGDTTGQAPQVNNSGSPSAASPGQASSDNTSTTANATAPQYSSADYERMIADLRKEAAGHRTKASDFEKQLKAFQDAQLTDAQKRERDFTEMQTKHLEATLENQRLRLQVAGFRLAGQLGIADIGAALALVQVEHGNSVAFDEQTNEPSNLKELLEAVIAAHPALAAPPQSQAAQAGQQAAQQRPQVTTGPAMNPARGQAAAVQPARDLRTQPLRTFTDIEWKR